MKTGKVFLVGAGPGDPGLVTVKGVGCIESADVVVFDRLVNKHVLALARGDAELIDVGKLPGGRGSRQKDINSLLVAKARDGWTVVRLKGGDPFVFGRGGEECEALRAEGIPFEVVPGITSAVAAPAYAGIPLTHRGVASSFTVVTGSESPDKSGSAVAWEALAQQEGTLVLLMGWQHLKSIIDSLVTNGRSPATPVALVQWGTEPHQKTVVGTLSDVADKAREAGLSPPVVAVVGDVVGLRERLRWFDNRPLFGKRVLVTRTRSQAGALSRLLMRRGALPIELPTIEARPLDDYSRLDESLAHLDGYDWVIFTSVNAVRAVFERLATLGLDARAFGAAHVGAVGSTTAESLRGHGISPDYVPNAFQAEAMVSGMKSRGVSKGTSVLVPQADIATETLRDGLTSLGATNDAVVAYRTVTPADADRRARDILSDGIDIATFTSSSTVRNLANLLAGELDILGRATIACIGPVTAATAKEVGLRVDIMSKEHTIKGLVDALEAHFS